MHCLAVAPLYRTRVAHLCHGLFLRITMLIHHINSLGCSWAYISEDTCTKSLHKLCHMCTQMLSNWSHTVWTAVAKCLTVHVRNIREAMQFLCLLSVGIESDFYHFLLNKSHFEVNLHYHTLTQSEQELEKSHWF